MAIKGVLDVSANVAVIAICLLIGGTIAEKRFFAKSQKEPVYGLHTGQPLPAIKGITYSAKK